MLLNKYFINNFLTNKIIRIPQEATVAVHISTLGAVK